MVGQRSPASRRKRFRFLVCPGGASNSRGPIVEESETAILMSPFGGESRSWRAVEELAGYEGVDRTAEADKSLKI